MTPCLASVSLRFGSQGSSCIRWDRAAPMPDDVCTNCKTFYPSVSGEIDIRRVGPSSMPIVLSFLGLYLSLAWKFYLPSYDSSPSFWSCRHLSTTSKARVSPSSSLSRTPSELLFASVRLTARSTLLLFSCWCAYLKPISSIYPLRHLCLHRTHPSLSECA